jgi:hypothetical protein
MMRVVVDDGGGGSPAPVPNQHKGALVAEFNSWGSNGFRVPGLNTRATKANNRQYEWEEIGPIVMWRQGDASQGKRGPFDFIKI